MAVTMGYEILKFPYYPWYTFVRIFAVGVSNTFLKYSHSFSGLHKAIAMFLMTREVWSTEAGLLAAACMAIGNQLISYSVTVVNTCSL